MENSEPRPTFKAVLLEKLSYVGEVLAKALKCMDQSNVTIMASGLVYSTLVAVVPCITFFMAFLSVFGLLQPFVGSLSVFFDEVLGEVIGTQVMDMITQYTSNAMGLGVIGLVSFIITATFLVNKVYTVLNQVFRAQARSGTFKRFSSFVTFLILAVVMLAVVISLNSWALSAVRNVVGVEQNAGILSRITGYLVGFAVAVLLLFLLYYYVPNAKIRSRIALIGAVFSTVCLTILLAVFKTVVETSVSYSVIYGSLASVFFVLLFLYACWYIVLAGAEVIYVLQFKPEGPQLDGGSDTPSRQVADAVDLMMLVGSSFKSGEGAVSLKSLMRRLAMPPSSLGFCLNLLMKEKLILETGSGKSASYVPARPLDQIYLREIFDAVYGTGVALDVETAGEAVAEQVKIAADSSFSQLTLENLLERV